jgi:hypothetical protein
LSSRLSRTNPNKQKPTPIPALFRAGILTYRKNRANYAARPARTHNFQKALKYSQIHTWQFTDYMIESRQVMWQEEADETRIK